MDQADAKRAKEEYLKKYLSDAKPKSTKKVKSKKKKNVKAGIRVHEEDVFAVVEAPAIAETSSDEDELAKSCLKEAVDVQIPLQKFRKTFVNVADTNDGECSPKHNGIQSVSCLSGTEISSTPLGYNRTDDFADEVNACGSRDASPPRRRRRRLDSDRSDISLSNGEQKHSHPNSRDNSLSRRTMRRMDSDRSSAPLLHSKHKRIHVDSRDASPPRRTRKIMDSDGSDISPSHRKQKRIHPDSRDTSPSRRTRRRMDSDGSDASPSQSKQKLKKRINADSRDTSPPRRTRRRMDSDRSDVPPSHTKQNRIRSNSQDASPFRRSKNRFGSPRQRSSHDRNRTTFIKSEPDSPKSNRYTLIENNGKSAAIRKESVCPSENEVKLPKRPHIARRGKRETIDNERKKREEKKQMELQEKYDKWSKGVYQSVQRVEQLNEMSRVMQEDFARYADDEAMNQHLKSVVNVEDPMYKYVKKKENKIKVQNGPVYPAYKGSWYPNRFGIAPGYRWDSVDRSNGYEDKLAADLNKKKAAHAESLMQREF